MLVHLPFRIQLSMLEYYTLTGYHINIPSMTLDELKKLAGNLYNDVRCISVKDGVLIGIVSDDVLGDIGKDTPILAHRSHNVLPTDNQVFDTIQEEIGICIAEHHRKNFGSYTILSSLN